MILFFRCDPFVNSSILDEFTPLRRRRRRPPHHHHHRCYCRRRRTIAADTDVGAHAMTAASPARRDTTAAVGGDHRAQRCRYALAPKASGNARRTPCGSLAPRACHPCIARAFAEGFRRPYKIDIMNALKETRAALIQPPLLLYYITVATDIYGIPNTICAKTRT